MAQVIILRKAQDGRLVRVTPDAPPMPVVPRLTDEEVEGLTARALAGDADDEDVAVLAEQLLLERARGRGRLRELAERLLGKVWSLLD